MTWTCLFIRLMGNVDLSLVGWTVKLVFDGRRLLDVTCLCLEWIFEGVNVAVKFLYPAKKIVSVTDQQNNKI